MRHRAPGECPSGWAQNALVHRASRAGSVCASGYSGDVAAQTAPSIPHVGEHRGDWALPSIRASGLTQLRFAAEFELCRPARLFGRKTARERLFYEVFAILRDLVGRVAIALRAIPKVGESAPCMPPQGHAQLSALSNRATAAARCRHSDASACSCRRPFRVIE